MAERCYATVAGKFAPCCEFGASYKYIRSCMSPMIRLTPFSEVINLKEVFKVWALVLVTMLDRCFYFLDFDFKASYYGIIRCK